MSFSIRTSTIPSQELFDRLMHRLDLIVSALDKHLSEENPKCTHNIREVLKEAHDSRLPNY